jgi:hypothetical protein
MLVRFGRVLYWLCLLLAALVFVFPGAQLVELWTKDAPPSPADVAGATVAVQNSDYIITLTNGHKYEVTGPHGSSTEQAPQALDVLRDQFAKEKTSYDTSWSDFRYMLAGAFIGAIVLVLFGRAIRYVLSNE